MGILDEAYARQEAVIAHQRQHPIDYDRMNREWPKQKAALTRAVNRYKAARESLRDRVFMDDMDIEAARERVAQVCRDAVRVWNEVGAWPDDWALFQRALDDCLPYNRQVDLRYL